MSNSDRFEPALYCVMAVGGSAFGNAMFHYFGLSVTYLIGILLVGLLTWSFIKDHRQKKRLDFGYLRLVSAFVAYFGLVSEEQFGSPNGQGIRLLTVVFISGVLLPFVELGIRYYQLHKVRGE